MYSGFYNTYNRKSIAFRQYLVKKSCISLCRIYANEHQKVLVKAHSFMPEI